MHPHGSAAASKSRLGACSKAADPSLVLGCLSLYCVSLRERMWQQFLGEKVRKGMVLFMLEYSLLHTRYGRGPEQPGAADPAPRGEKTSDFQRSLPALVIL